MEEEEYNLLKKYRDDQTFAVLEPQWLFIVSWALGHSTKLISSAMVV
jgi:hypothetical protein